MDNNNNLENNFNFDSNIYSVENLDLKQGSFTLIASKRCSGIFN